MTRAAVQPDLTPYLTVAATKYARAYENALTRTGAAAMSAKDNLRLARAVLEPAETAVVDMLAGKGMALSVLASKTGRKAQDLAALFTRACAKLARHYEASAAEDAR